MANPPRPARPHEPHFDRIPGELSGLRQFVGWRYELRGVRWTKVPYQPRSPHAKAHADGPETWATLAEAIDAYRSARYDGIGFEFSREDPFFGVDLDNCLEGGEVAEWARPFVDAMEGTYAEISPSGKGIKFFGRGKLPTDKGGRKLGFGPDGTGALEIYDHGRYFALTGAVFGGCDTVADKQAAAEALYAVIRPPRPAKAPRPGRPGPPPDPADGPSPDPGGRADGEVLARLLRVPKYQEIYDGNWEGHAGPSSSEADWTLIRRLAYLCGPGREEQVVRLFKGSPLARRGHEKMTRPGDSYVKGTVGNAYAGLTSYARWAAPGANGKAAGPPAEAAPPEGGRGDDDEYILNRECVPYSCVTNALRWLRRHGPTLRFDTFRDRVVVGDGPISDRIIIELVSSMESHWLTAVNKMHVRDAITTLADSDRFSSLSRYLEGLEWDGIARIEQFLSDHFNVADTPYHREVGRILFLSGVARGMEPGCKVDTVPLLIGPQGNGKSDAGLALCPDKEWFTDEIGNIAADRAGENLRGKWIVEAAELSRVNQSTLEATKKFITCQSDRYKVPWETMPRDFPRTNIFFGSTNDDTPLRDLENRRFLPVKIPGQTEAEKQRMITAITDARDLLWGEAMHRYKDGEKWWTTSSHLSHLVREEGGTARQIDSWEDLLRERLPRDVATQELTGERTTVADAAELLGVKSDKLDKSAQTRIGYALRALGFERMRDPKPPRVTFYVIPSVPPQGVTD